MHALIPDFTLLVQLGIFFACWAVLHFLVFKPYLALIHARHEKSTGLKEKAAADRAKAERLKTDYEEFMKAERKKIAAWTDNERKKVSEEEHHIVQTARDEAGEELKVVRAKVQTEVEKARKELTPQIRDYSSHIVSKLVGYKVSVPQKMEASTADNSRTTVVP